MTDSVREARKTQIANALPKTLKNLGRIINRAEGCSEAMERAVCRVDFNFEWAESLTDLEIESMIEDIVETEYPGSPCR